MSIDTVNDLPPRVQYVAAAAQVAFDYPFPIFADGDLVAVVDGTTKALNTDYTVTGEGDDLGGALTFGTPMAGGEIVTIYRDIAIARDTDFQQNGPFRAAAINDEFAKSFLIMQQLESRINRALRFPITAEATDAQLELSPLANWVGKYVTINAQGVPEPGTLVAGTLTQSVIGQLLYPLTAAEALAGVVPSSYAYPELNLRRYGGAPGAGNNTAAMDRAEAVCAAQGGGVIVLDTAGEWRMNWVCVTDSVMVSGAGGRAEFDLYCVRPYSLASAPITFGDGTVDLRYSGLHNIHLSGTNDVGGAHYNDETYNAPQALKIHGCITLLFQQCYFYNGLHTLHMEPSATVPITGITFDNCLARNDLDGAGTRLLYGKRVADPGYLTNVHFRTCKFNSHAEYFGELDGTLVGGAVWHFNGGYGDCPPAKGFLLKGGAMIRSQQFDLDPGATGVVIVETDNAQDDPAKFIFGNLTHGGQKIRFAGGIEVLMPTQAFDYTYNQRLFAPFFGPTCYVSTSTDPFNTGVTWDLSSSTGPLALHGSNLRAGKRIDVMGGNASLSGTVDAIGAGGGIRVDALGTNQNAMLVPSGTGQVVLGGAYTRPSGDNTQDLGGSGNRWAVVYAGTGAINTSDERAKMEIEAIPDAWLDAWGDVQWQRFKFRDAVASKGDSARWHVGLVAQQVVKAFAQRGLDAFAIGLACFDEWDDEYEDQGIEVEAEINGRKVKVRAPGGEMKLTRKAGSLFGVRYEEALVLEAAWVRRELQSK